MKIETVEVDRRRKSFAIRAGERDYRFPFAKLPVPPTADDPVAEVFVDPELGCEAFTYRLQSGSEDSVHLDNVRLVALDPEALQEQLLHRLTVEALEALEASGLGKRQVARLLGTSPSQLYRLLDPTNYSKSIGQMLALLHLTDRDVVVVVRHRDKTKCPVD